MRSAFFWWVVWQTSWNCRSVLRPSLFGPLTVAILSRRVLPPFTLQRQRLQCQNCPICPIVSFLFYIQTNLLSEKPCPVSDLFYPPAFQLQVKLLNVPTDFGPEFLEWAKKTAKDRQQNRFILHGEDTQSSFDTVMAKDAVEKSSGQWRKDGREKSYALVWFGYGLACLCFAFVG